MADPLYDLMQANPQMWLSKMVAPNAMSLLQGQPDPRVFPTDAGPGKIPSMDDPRVGGSAIEALMLAGSALPAGRAAMGASTAGRMIPEAMQAVPGIPGAAKGGATLAAILGATGGDNATAGDFNWSDPNQGRVKRLEYLDKEIEKEATRKTPSAKGTQKARIDSLTAEKSSLIEAQTKEYNTALEQYTNAKADERKQMEATRQAEAPFRERFPNAYQALPLVGWGTAGLAGAVAGAKWPGLKSQIGSALGGGLESAAFSAGPTIYDSETLPYGSKYQQEAEKLVFNPNYWAGRVGPAAGIGAAAGFTGAKWGGLVRKPAGAMPQGGQPPGGPSASDTSGTPTGSAPQGQLPSTTIPAPKPQGSYVTYKTQDGTKVTQTPYGWRGPTGFIKKPEGPLEKLMGLD